MFKDYFVETAENLSNLTSAEIRSKLQDLDLMLTCTPSIQVADGLHLTYCRIGDVLGNAVAFDDRAREAIVRFDGVLVAQSFDELWDTYERSANYFVVDVTFDDGNVNRMPLAALEPQHEALNNIARAPGTILGGPDFQKEFKRKSERGALQEQLQKLIEQVQGSNELGEEERKNILGYLGAIDALLGQPNPDKVALRMLFKRMGKSITKYSARLGERYVTSEILEFIKDVLGSNLPF